MENRSDNLPYLKLFHDKTQNFLLQQPEEGLEVQDPTLHVESIFTEIDGSSDWPVENYPILLNGSLISEDQQLESSSINLDTEQIHLSELYEEPEDLQTATEDANDSNSPIYPIISEVPGKGFITTDGLFLCNDVLMHLNMQSDENLDQAVEDEEPYSNGLDDQDNSLTVTPSNVDNDCNEFVKEEINGNINNETENISTVGELLNVPNLSGITNVIQLLSSDGAILTLDKNILSNLSQSPESCLDPTVEDIQKYYENMFDVLTVYKCKFCTFLCENLQNIINHLKDAHIAKDHEKEDIRNINIEEKKSDSVVPVTIKAVEMRSILNSNQKKRKKETKKTVYLCSQCNMGYSNKDDLKQHMIIEHNLVNLTHEQDTEVTNTNTKPPTPEKTEVVEEPKQKVANDLLTTLLIKQQKALKRVKCSFKGCEFRFAREDLRSRHEECHDGGQKKQFKCPECNEKFSVWRICSSHLWKCHNIDMGLLACPMCNKFKSVSFGRMKAHMAVHNEEFPFMCHYCAKGFKQYSQLKNHQVIHKEPELDTIPEWACQKQCDMCKKYFANSKTLKKHIQIVHNKFKPFICNICGHKAARKAMLDLHLRQHTGEKPHKCPICKYKTGDPNCLRRHIMRHDGETKYSCPHCDYQSIQSTSYKNHIANKHPGQGGSFYCSVCAYHTVSETAYYAHKLEHETGPNKSTNGINGMRSVVSHIDAEKYLQNSDISDNNFHSNMDMDDDETQNCFLNSDFIDETIDTGGITIPAGFELQVSM